MKDTLQGIFCSKRAFTFKEGTNLSLIGRRDMHIKIGQRKGIFCRIGQGFFVMGTHFSVAAGKRTCFLPTWRVYQTPPLPMCGPIRRSSVSQGCCGRVWKRDTKKSLLARLSVLFSVLLQGVVLPLLNNLILTYFFQKFWKMITFENTTSV